ncbi:unnamed protein product [Brassica oleracea var. botrytis]
MPSSNGVTKQRRKFSESIRGQMHHEVVTMRDCPENKERDPILSIFTRIAPINAYFGCSSECSTPKEHLKRLAMPTSANENIMPDPKDSHNIEGQPPLYAAAENLRAVWIPSTLQLKSHLDTLKISWTFLELAMKTDLLCATALHTAAIHACDGNSHLPKIAKNNGQAPLCSSVLMGNVLSFSSELCHRLRCPVKVVKITYMLIVCFYF